jgi:hypothetical protein
MVRFSSFFGQGRWCAGRLFGLGEFRPGLRLGLFGFVFGFGGWLRNSLLKKRLGRFWACQGGANPEKLALFGFALSRETRCPNGRKSLFYMMLGAFDFLKNWLCFFK